LSRSPASRDAAGRRRRRVLDGIVLLDKPAGLGSTPALQRVRWLLRAEKAGHAGTLDPFATGMLPLCFGQATKACGSLLGSRKAYRARLALGAATATGDVDGAIVRTAPVPAITEAQARLAMAAFTGVRDQVPPMYSALKLEGRPLYERARRGEHVERAPRRIEIERLELVSLAPESIEFEVTCSKGTYVRVLGEELAAALGTEGHLAELRRTWVEPFEDSRMVALAEVEAWAAQELPDEARPGWLLPTDAALAGLPRVDLDATASLHARQGRAISLPGVAPAGDVRAYGPEGSFLGVLTVDAAGQATVRRLYVPGAADPPQT
jgi:tRNA pseudouridine55 synthase